MFKASLKMKKGQNSQKSETIKLILKNLSNQYSLKEVIDCVFSSQSKNKDLRTIMEFLLKEEGKLKIIQYLLHLGDSNNNNKNEENDDIQDMDDSLENINSIRPRLRKRKVPTVYSVSSSDKSEDDNNNIDNLLNPIFIKSKEKRNKILNDDDIKEINLVEKEEAIPINININSNGSDTTTLELNEKKNINKKDDEEILILDENNNNILNENKPKKIEEEKILEINYEMNNPETMKVKATSIKDKIIEIPLNENDNIQNEKKEEKEEIKEIIKENKEKEEIKEIKENKNKKDFNICLSSDDENSTGIKIQDDSKEKKSKNKNIKSLESIFIPNNISISLKAEPTKPKDITLSNITAFLSKKRGLNLEDNDDNIYLKYYYTIDNGKFYKYKIISEEIGIANLICDDYRCNGKGMYIIQDKMFNIVSRHNILNSEHTYVQNMSKIDKEYFDNMKNNKQFGIEVNVRKIK